MSVLVTAASRHGATAEIAQTIGDRLRELGLDVRVTDPVSVTGVAGFEAVVLGSAVYAGHWLDDAKDLVTRLGDELAGRPVWLFSSGPVGDPPRPEEDAVDVADLATATGAVEHRVFAGTIDRDQLGFMERAVIRALRAPTGDFRDVAAIRAWADEIADTLLHGHAGAEQMA